jgi:succinoglycan biosynthesis protein ExoM
MDPTASPAIPHIAVCVCTFKRPDLLARLLSMLEVQQTDGRFSFSLVVIDNDASGSAEGVVEEFQGVSNLKVCYSIEPIQSISLARNRAVRLAKGQFLAFIDDDELPPKDWLLALFNGCLKFNADGVLGPVKPRFENPPPDWVVRGGFYDRPSYPTGFFIDWRKGRTGNVLLKMEVFNGIGEPFDPKFVTGEDQDFFRRVIERGHRFVWCEEALAYETVPSIRWSRSFMLRRALLRGKISIRHCGLSGLDVLKSFLAVPAYCAFLPFTLISGEHAFMKYLVKICDHTGRILAVLKLNPIGEKYVTE